MAIHGYFFNAVKVDDVYDRVYNANDVTSYLDKIVGSGVFPNPSNQLQVVASSGMEVIVKAGQGWINGHKMISDSDLVLELDESDVLLNRIDIVVFYVDYNNREMGIEVKKGTPASSPVVPALVRTSYRYELMLASISVPKQTTDIVQTLITDTRANSVLCGFVAGLIQQVDTSSLFIQYQSAYQAMLEQMSSWMVSQQLAFQEWMDTLTSELQVGAYITSFEKAENNPANNEIVLDMTGYIYEPSDVVLVFINGLSANKGVDFSVDDSGELAKVVLSNLSPFAWPANNVKVLIFKSVLGVPVEAGSIWEQVQIRNIMSMNVSFSQEEGE